MILVWLIAILLAGGILAWAAEGFRAGSSRWLSLFVLLLDLIIVLQFLPNLSGRDVATGIPWLSEMGVKWIPQLGIGLHLAMDGLSFILVLLTFLLGLASVSCSWNEIRERVGFFHFNLLWTLAGITGVFLALDLFLFYFFWELMLIPMYFLIALWGHENRVYASVKFFIFTQLSGLFMLAAILGVYFIHGRITGSYTFDYMQLLGTPFSTASSSWLMLGFFIAFAVKLPAVPFHSWLPDAHTEAPTAGSVILAGLLLKTGAYGLLRFLTPLFPDAAARYASIGMILGVAGILYGAILAFAQTDLKRLVAYTSISHMGFVLLGIAIWNSLSLQGAVMQMVCHGISTGALFIMVGSLQERLKTRDIGRMGGFWGMMPRMGGVVLFFALASLGLPGMGNFVGEFLILLGAYRVHPTITVIATTGLVAAAVYALWMVQKVFHGKMPDGRKRPDLSAREMAIMTVLMVAILSLGLYPQPVFDVAGPPLERLQKAVILEKKTETVNEGMQARTLEEDRQHDRP
jgi:NADH-quinone oxidoreductase subunit M